MKITSVILWIGLIATAVFIIINGSPENMTWWFVAFLLYILNAIPFVALDFCNRSCNGSFISKIIVLVGSLILTGIAVYFMYFRFILHQGVYTGTAFLIIPLYLIGVVLVTILLAWTFNNPTKKQEPVPPEDYVY